MNRNKNERPVILGEYVVKTGATVRETAKMFGVSKSTVHKDITDRLEDMNETLFNEVKVILEQHKDERHIRGGIATKEKYLAIRKRKTLPPKAGKG